MFYPRRYLDNQQSAEDCQTSIDHEEAWYRNDSRHDPMLARSIVYDPPALALERYENDFPSSIPWMPHVGPETHSISDIPYGGQHFHEKHMHPYLDRPRLSSAFTSGSSSVYTSDTLSDRQSPPVNSPHLAIVRCSPMPYSHDQHGYGSRGFGSDEYELAGTYEQGHPCVAMENVQRYADPQPEEIPLEYQPYTYAPVVHDGVVPMQVDYDDHAIGNNEEPAVADHPQANIRRQSTGAPVVRRRRRQIGRSATTVSSPTRGHRRPPARRSISHIDRRVSTRSSTTSPILPVRAFPCLLAAYGCTMSFSAKNEWKRHVYRQHLRLEYWRCNQCPTDKGKNPNDFNRKDLFIQHVRRMHPVPQKVSPDDSFKTDIKEGPKTKTPKESTNEENDLAELCFRNPRSPPIHSRCVFCDERFQGRGSFEARLEHIGKHMENAKKEELPVNTPTQWHTDEATDQWLHDNKVVVRAGDTFTLNETCT